jgi:hypothetical protein
MPLTTARLTEGRAGEALNVQNKNCSVVPGGALRFVVSLHSVTVNAINYLFELFTSNYLVRRHFTHVTTSFTRCRSRTIYALHVFVAATSVQFCSDTLRQLYTMTSQLRCKQLLRHSASERTELADSSNVDYVLAEVLWSSSVATAKRPDITSITPRPLPSKSVEFINRRIESYEIQQQLTDKC